jgi:V8-like Glu-specific endopeptidase
MENNVCLEKNVKKSLNPVSLKGIEKIQDQMKYSICKVHKEEGETGTGFLCNLPYNSDKKSFLVTNNHVLNEKDIENNKKIRISFNNEKIYEDIIIDESRITLTNKDLDLTLIEIMSNDIKKENLIIFEHILDADEKFYEIEEEYINTKCDHKSIYTLHYPKDDEVVVSFGLMKMIRKNKDKYKIQHSCCTDNGSSGAPILSLKDFKVVGIHYGCPINNEFNEGIFIKSIILELKRYKKYNIVQNDNNSSSQLNCNDNLFNNNMKINNINNINNFTEKILSKNEYSQTILSYSEENKNTNLFNIIFEESSNFRTFIIIPSNKDASQLFDIYKRNRKANDSSKDDILFLYNGSFINTNQNIKISEIFQNLSKITVLDKT